MTYKNKLNMSTILTAQLKGDVAELKKDLDSGLFGYGLEGMIMFKNAENKVWEKIKVVLETMLFEQEQAGISAYDLSREI
jgi:hypothetical protein